MKFYRSFHCLYLEETKSNDVKTRINIEKSTPQKSQYKQNS